MPKSKKGEESACEDRGHRNTARQRKLREGKYKRRRRKEKYNKRRIRKEELEKKKGNSKDKDYFYSIKWVKLRLF